MFSRGYRSGTLVENELRQNILPIRRLNSVSVKRYST